jgi:hypothetical protein
MTTPSNHIQIVRVAPATVRRACRAHLPAGAKIVQMKITSIDPQTDELVVVFQLSAFSPQPSLP